MRYFIFFLIFSHAQALDVGFQDTNKVFLKITPTWDKQGNAELDKFTFSICTVDQKTCALMSKCSVTRKAFQIQLTKLDDNKLKDDMTALLNSSFQSSLQSTFFIGRLEKILSSILGKTPSCTTLNMRLKSCHTLEKKMQVLGPALLPNNNN